MKYLLAALALVLGCQLMQGASELEDMTAVEAEQYAARTGVTIRALAQAALEEGDIDHEDVGQIADVLRGVAVGSAGSFVSDRIGDTEGYTRLALTLALLELEPQVSVDGIVTERGAMVLEAIADQLDTL